MNNIYYLYFILILFVVKVYVMIHEDKENNQHVFILGKIKRENLFIHVFYQS